MLNPDQAIFHCPGRVAAGPGSKPVCGAPDWNHDEHDYPARADTPTSAQLAQVLADINRRIDALIEVLDALGYEIVRQAPDAPICACGPEHRAECAYAPEDQRCTWCHRIGHPAEAHPLPKGHPQYDAFYDATDDELAEVVQNAIAPGRSDTGSNPSGE